ncbi:MAG: hypothetical protein HUU47_07650 [Bacteroidetes bacterium]|nr:hypothetical protein [Bacteroidota bacterium]
MKAIIVAEYTINQKFIIKNYCINKNKPKLKCYGTCHLKKQLDKQENTENLPLNNSKVKFETEFFFEIAEKSPLAFFQLNIDFPDNYKFKKIKEFNLSVYHPPEIS